MTLNHRVIRLLGAIATLVATLASAPSPESLAPLRAGDHLTILVFNHPELSGERVVDSDGTVTVPLAGTLLATGLLAKTLASHIEASLHRYLPYAAVDVQRKSEGGSIIVAGWPYPIIDGVVKYMPDQTLASAVAEIRASVSYNQFAPTSQFDPYHSRIDMRSVIVERDGRRLGTYDMVALAASGEPGPVLRPGDTVRFINKPVAIQVTGAVKQPGYAYLSPDEPLTDALDQVGGLTDDAATYGVVLDRQGTRVSLPMTDARMRSPGVSGDQLNISPAPQVVVGGVVLKPGTVMLKNDPSLLAAVFDAGGPDKDSDLSHIRVIRNGQAKVYDVTAITHGDVTQNPNLQDGDEVLVPRGRRIDASVFASILANFRWLIAP